MTAWTEQGKKAFDEGAAGKTSINNLWAGTGTFGKCTRTTSKPPIARRQRLLHMCSGLHTC